MCNDLTLSAIVTWWAAASNACDIAAKSWSLKGNMSGPYLVLEATSRSSPSGNHTLGLIPLISSSSSAMSLVQ